jgi:hypothetical protein
MNSYSPSSPRSSPLKSENLDEIKRKLDKMYDKLYSISLNENMNVVGNDPKNLIIIFLLILLILTFFGINVLGLSAYIIKTIYSYFAFIFGSLITEISNLFSNTLKTTIDVLDATIKNIGNILISSSTSKLSPPNFIATSQLDLNTNNNNIKRHLNEPKEDSTENPIQNPISSNKNNWCLIGEYENKRGCVEVSQGYKCMSGQLYFSKQQCENPNPK